MFLLRYQVARVMSRYEIRRADGLVCVDCGRRAFCYDHRHYGKPLEFEPVCRTCNHNRGPALDVLSALHPLQY